MTTNKVCTIVISLAALSGGPAALRAEEPVASGLTRAEFEKLHKELQPPLDEL